MTENNQETNERTIPDLQTRKPGGLYGNVKMSVRTANIFVAIGVVALALCMFFLVSHNGFTVTFDTNGGSYVNVVKVMHGETVPMPAEPVKENWTFTGWYLDRDCTSPWNMASDTVTDSMTLFAGWAKKDNIQTNAS